MGKRESRQYQGKDINVLLAEFGLRIEVLPVESIQEYENNPRVHDEQSIKAIASSIEAFGFKDVLICDKDLVLIAGHGRLRAAKQLGVKKLPVLIVTDLDPMKAKAYRLAHNKTHEFSDWEPAKLSVELLELEEMNFSDLSSIGFESPDQFDVANADAIPEASPQELSRKWDVRHGQIWCVHSKTVPGGKHLVLCGDALILSSYHKIMPEGQIGMVFADPPYDMSSMEYAAHIFALVPESCHVFIMHSERNLVRLAATYFDYFRKLFAIDYKQATLVSNNQPMTRVDFVAEFLKGRSRYRNLNDAFSTLIESVKIHRSDVRGNFGVVYAKSVELPLAFIKHYATPGDVILDPFTGSGSTLVAAEIAGCLFRGIEIDPAIVACCLERCNAFGLEVELVQEG